MTARLAVAWGVRATPLPARAVIGRGAAAIALARRLAALDDGALAGLAAVAGRGVIAVIAEGDAALPWADGVVYLGRDPAAPELLLPTALAPSVSLAVLARAVRQRAKAPAPLAVLPDLVVPCSAARAIDRGKLAAWLAAEGG